MPQSGWYSSAVIVGLKRQKRQSIERAIASLQTCLSLDSTLVDSENEDLYLFVHHDCESGVWSIFTLASGRVRNFDALCDSDADTPLRCMRLVSSRKCTLVFEISMGEWKIFVAVMYLLILNGVLSFLKITLSQDICFPRL